MKILIADDSPVSILLLENMLEDWGDEVLTVRDGLAAWDVLRRPDSPPLAVLDWVMPGMDGVEICRKVRQESEAPYVYLVLVTGKSRTQDVVEGIESGADDFVSKPFEEQELRVRLRAGQRIVNLHQTLRDQAYRDVLTGCWNRRMIIDILQREIGRGAREGTPLGVIMADLDHFKRINDTLGHPEGDAVLCEASRRMASTLRPYDAIGRYGGEEFLIVLPGCDLSSTLTVAERIRNSVAESPVSTTAGKTPVSVSLGAANSQARSLDANLLIRAADEALYRAKRGGRDRVAVALNSGA